MNNIPNDLIQNIKEKTQDVFSKFVTQDEIKSEERNKEQIKEQEKKQHFIERNLKNKVVKILVEDFNSKKIDNIFIAHCQYDNNMLSFAPQKNDNNEQFLTGVLLNSNDLNYDFTIPGNGIDKIWHITPLF